MRGTPYRRRQHRLYQGIIPAYAGNTHVDCRVHCCDRDHPRVCGEHECAVICRVMVPGSSPRMRGTRNRRNCLDCAPGIIPAYAGNTHGSPQPRTSPRDHPRVCGEHRVHFVGPVHASGSSPRMRGTHVQRTFDLQLVGIIPAYAGNTAVPPIPPSARRDHPRVCGEH